MVVIRLARHGRHKYPVYRIVAADKRRAATSKFLAILGTYNPHTKEITLNKEEIARYLDNGAQASDRVLRILKAEGVKLPKWAKTHDRNKKPKKAEAEGEQPQATPAEGKPAKDGEASEEKAPAESDSNPEPATDEVASEAAEKAEENAADVKTDIGSEKENQDVEKVAETAEKVTEAVEKTEESENSK